MILHQDKAEVSIVLPGGVVLTSFELLFFGNSWKPAPYHLTADCVAFRCDLVAVVLAKSLDCFEGEAHVLLASGTPVRDKAFVDVSRHVGAPWGRRRLAALQRAAGERVRGGRVPLHCVCGPMRGQAQRHLLPPRLALPRK